MVEIAELGGQRMQDHGSRLVGLDGMAVRSVREVGDQLDLEVELIVRGRLVPALRPRLASGQGPPGRAGARSAGRRPRNVAGVAQMAMCLRALRAHVQRDPPELPARQRVTARLCRRLLERVRGGAAHAEVAREEQTTRYQVARAFCDGREELADARARRPPRRLSLDEAHHRRAHELATVVSDLDRRRVIEVLDARSRRRIERYLRSLPETTRRAITVVSIDPYEAYRQAVRNELPDARIVVDHFHLVRGANTALDSVRRERQRDAGRRSRPKGTRRSGKSARWSQDLYRARHRLLKARERLTEREQRRLCALFEREPLIAEAWALKEAFRSIYRACDRREAELRLEHFLAAVDRAQLPAFTAFAEGIRLWRTELLAYFHEPTTNGYAEGSSTRSRSSSAAPTAYRPSMASATECS